jgi:hypothetical protein
VLEQRGVRFLLEALQLARNNITKHASGGSGGAGGGGSSGGGGGGSGSSGTVVKIQQCALTILLMGLRGAGPSARLSKALDSERTLAPVLVHVLERSLGELSSALPCCLPPCC